MTPKVRCQSATDFGHAGLDADKVKSRKLTWSYSSLIEAA